MTRALLLLLSLFLLSQGPILDLARAQNPEAFMVVDNQTGHILSSLNANKKRPIASLTKIATAIVVLDWSDIAKQDLDSTATVPAEAVMQDVPNPMSLQPGDRLTLRDLLYAALLQSDNVAAHTLAHHVGEALLPTTPASVRGAGPVGVFVNQMNALARQLAMRHTLFLNPHGLDGGRHGSPYSTASDVARLTRSAMAKASFRFFVSQEERKISIHRGEETLQFLLKNTNQLLGHDAIDGVKTGRTARAGDCIALSAARSPEAKQVGTQVMVTPRRISVVVLAAADRFQAGRDLLAQGWQLYDQWAAQGRPNDPKQSL